MNANEDFIHVFEDHDWVEPKTLVEVADGGIIAAMNSFTHEELELAHVLQAIIVAITIGTYIGEHRPVFNKYSVDVIRKMTLEEYTSLLESLSLDDLDDFFQQIEVNQLGRVGRATRREARKPEVMRYLEDSKAELQRLRNEHLELSIKQQKLR